MIQKYNETPTPPPTKNLFVLISFLIMCACALLLGDSGKVYSRIAEAVH